MVLIAEESERRSELWSAFLCRYGCEVEVVSSGVECLWRLRQRRPDVLVLSQGLLWGGGDGVLACLREAGESPPVLLIADGAGDSPEELARPPVLRCLRRPFALASLLGGVLTAAEAGRRQRDDAVTAPGSASLLAAQDLDLQQRVERALSATGYPALRNVAVEVRSGEVTLRGRVGSYHLTQLAEAAARKLADAGRLHNELTVAGFAEGPASGRARGCPWPR